jgi:(4S)-4-hydroxy-5-phosphonooxypentane-2,3-dione isomerase
MVVLYVTLQIKPEHVTEFVDIARYDAEHSERDESGCVRVDVIRDRDDPNRFYFYEVYRDAAALEAHRETAHFKLYFEKTQPWLAAPPERRFGNNIVPVDANWR